MTAEDSAINYELASYYAWTWTSPECGADVMTIYHTPLSIQPPILPTLHLLIFLTMQQTTHYISHLSIHLSILYPPIQPSSRLNYSCTRWKHPTPQFQKLLIRVQWCGGKNSHSSWPTAACLQITVDMYTYCLSSECVRHSH